MKKILITFILIIVAFFIVWGGSIIKCEILTARHKSELFTYYEELNMISKPDYIKVIKYTQNEAKLYFVSKRINGVSVLLSKKDDTWVVTEWKVVWSKFGSADGYIWPYVR